MAMVKGSYWFKLQAWLPSASLEGKNAIKYPTAYGQAYHTGKSKEVPFTQASLRHFWFGLVCFLKGLVSQGKVYSP